MKLSQILATFTLALGATFAPATADAQDKPGTDARLDRTVLPIL